jgi:hypothetical protein
VFLICKAQPCLRSFLVVHDAQKFHAFARVAPIVLRATHLENPRAVFRRNARCEMSFPQAVILEPGRASAFGVPHCLALLVRVDKIEERHALRGQTRLLPSPV